jgi:hypothetical protein
MEFYGIKRMKISSSFVLLHYTYYSILCRPTAERVTDLSYNPHQNSFHGIRDCITLL